MPEQEDERRPTAVVTITRECARVHIPCDITFLRNSQREVRARDNGQSWAEDGYKSLWLNLWMIGIRGARGRMCALCSDPVCDHVSPVTTLGALNTECSKGWRLISKARRTYCHKARHTSNASELTTCMCSICPNNKILMCNVFNLTSGKSLNCGVCNQKCS